MEILGISLVTNAAAGMKKGTASNGKLSAPLITFCARICASNMSRCHIRVTPDSSSA